MSRSHKIKRQRLPRTRASDSTYSETSTCTSGDEPETDEIVEELIETKAAAKLPKSSRSAQAEARKQQSNIRGSASLQFDQKAVLEALEKEFGIRQFRPGRHAGVRPRN